MQKQFRLIFTPRGSDAAQMLTFHSRELAIVVARGHLLEKASAIRLEQRDKDGNWLSIWSQQATR